eukprot:TRINITY_DN547740_c0_g1_i1.p3 TRINITY_DN547740_c0_g1~~TRINITY_DN547740_c0_g1_i1.p3  ORF type:complete len:152 (+),score=14.03 TRINITY_DN547740_c0_g1_i1:94-549(+)
MKHILRKALLLSILIYFMSSNTYSYTFIDKQNKNETETKKQEELAVVWTSGDRDVAIKMVFMYTFNAKRMHWWDDIHFVIWGPSSKLLSEDKELQDYINKMKKAGVKLYACKACADMYGISDKLSELGIEVKYMGKDLTNFIKSDYKVITF